MFIRYLTEEEKNGYFAAYMKPAGYKEKLWLRDHLIYELHIDKGSPYTNIKIIKKTTSNEKCLIYNAYHKCMEKFRIKA